MAVKHTDEGVRNGWCMWRRFRQGKKVQKMTLTRKHFDDTVREMIVTSVFKAAGAKGEIDEGAEVEITSFVGGESTLTIEYRDFPKMMLAVMGDEGDFMPGLAQPFLVRYLSPCQPDVSRNQRAGSQLDSRATSNTLKSKQDGWPVISPHWIHATATLKDAVRAIPQPGPDGSSPISDFIRLPTDGYMLVTNAAALSDAGDLVRYRSGAFSARKSWCVNTAILLSACAHIRWRIRSPVAMWPPGATCACEQADTHAGSYCSLLEQPRTPA